MTHYIPEKPSFGDPAFNYPGPASLAVAVHMYPDRFSSDTHELVKEILSTVCDSSSYIALEPVNDEQLQIASS